MTSQKMEPRTRGLNPEKACLLELENLIICTQTDFRICYSMEQLLLLSPIVLFLNWNIYWGYHAPVSTLYVGCMVQFTGRI